MTGQLHVLSSRAVVGAFFKKLEEVSTAGWVDMVASKFTSNMPIETYAFLADSPVMKEKTSNYTKTTLGKSSFTLANKRFAAFLEVDEDDFRRDKTGQILTRVNELAVRAAQLPMRLLSASLNTSSGAGDLCYDGLSLYNASHVTLGGSSVNNIVTKTCTVTGVPTTAEAVDGMLSALVRIIGFPDDAGEPRNEFAQRFVAMCPPGQWAAVTAAVRNQYLQNAATNTLQNTGFEVIPIMNPRLTSTTKVNIFRADSDVKAMIWQDEVPAQLASLIEGSDYWTLNDARVYAAKRVCNGGSGRFDQTVQLVFA